MFSASNIAILDLYCLYCVTSLSMAGRAGPVGRCWMLCWRSQVARSLWTCCSAGCGYPRSRVYALQYLYKTRAHGNENPIYEFHEKELHGLSPNFLLLYSQNRSAYFPVAEQAEQLWEYINHSQTHECGNWD